MRILILLMALVLSGCKLVVSVSNGGSVNAVNASPGNCASNSICEYEVSDTNFTGVFTAVPSQGYVFSHWKGGDGHICGGLTEPCDASNTNLAGNAIAESFISSDAELKLVPIFVRDSAPNYVLRDGLGQVVGDIFDFDTTSVLARVIHVDNEGSEHGYLLRFSREGVSSALYVDSLYYTEPTCTLSDTFYLNGKIELLSPVFSNTYVALTISDGLKLAKINQQPPQEIFVYFSFGSLCSPAGITKVYPATIEVQDLESRFTPPFTLHRE